LNAKTPFFSPQFFSGRCFFSYARFIGRAPIISLFGVERVPFLPPSIWLRDPAPLFLEIAENAGPFLPLQDRPTSLS